MTDTTSMTGAEFRRHVGVDPTEWAEAFLAVYDEAFLREGDDPLIDREERIGFTAAWFRDYGEAAVAKALGREWGRQYHGLDTDKLDADVKARREALGRPVPQHDD